MLEAYRQVALRGGGFAAHYIKMDTARRSVIDTQISHEALFAAQADYASYYVSVDDRLPWYTTGEFGEWRADQQYLDEYRVRHTEIYHDFLKPIGIKRMVVCRLTDTGQRQEMLCIPRPRDAGDFGDADLQRLNFFSSHLVRAAQLRARLDELQARHDAAQGALDHLPYGALWLDARARIAWISPAAETLLAAADGLRIHAGHLHATQPRLDSRLRAALANATRASGREGSWFAVPRRGAPTSWLLSIVPGHLPPNCGSRGGPHALAILQDGAGPGLPHTRQLQMLYGLTPAEARLALGLLRHDTPGDYADRHHLSPATVKTHLRNLFAKTGTRRQADLLLKLALPLPAPTPSAGAPVAAGDGYPFW